MFSNEKNKLSCSFILETPWCVYYTRIKFQQYLVPEYFLDFLFSREAVVAKQNDNFLKNSLGNS